jgi:hypothetical protein
LSSKFFFGGCDTIVSHPQLAIGNSTGSQLILRPFDIKTGDRCKKSFETRLVFFELFVLFFHTKFTERITTKSLMSQARKALTYKLVLLGDAGVGKVRIDKT